MAIRHRKTLDESHRERRPNGEFYLRSPETQARRFAWYHPEAAANSVRIARRCAFDLTEDLGYSLPAPETEGGRTLIEELRHLCLGRLDRKYSFAERELAIARLEHELRLIEMNGLAGFFLVYFEVMQLATEVAAEVRGPSRARSVTELPPGRGRGSSVASIVCYVIGLSHIDPVQNNLFIRRFLNINKCFPRQSPVEVVLFSRNSPETGLRVMRSIAHYGLDISRAAFMKRSSGIR